VIHYVQFSNIGEVLSLCNS